MPIYMRRKTVREADKIFMTKSEKVLGVVKNGKIIFYPKNSYNLSICASINAKISGLRRIY